MRKAEREFGDGYFNAVLIDLITDSDLTQHLEIAEMVEHSTALRPDRASKRYNPCREMIADAISGRAKALTGPLHYSQEEAKAILVSALALFRPAVLGQQPTAGRFALSGDSESFPSQN